jgi:hypothetical protein
MRLVKVAIGIAIGLAFWHFVVPGYAFMAKHVAGIAAPSMFGHGWQVGGPGEDANLYRANGGIAATVFMRYVTTNVITLLVLFALSAEPFSPRNLLGCVAGIVCLIPVHAAAILVIAKSIVLPGTLWGNAAQAYSIFGSHAFAFALWWLLRPGESAASATGKPARRRARGKS